MVIIRGIDIEIKRRVIRRIEEIVFIWLEVEEGINDRGKMMIEDIGEGE